MAYYSSDSELDPAEWLANIGGEGNGAEATGTNGADGPVADVIGLPTETVGADGGGQASGG